MSKVPFASSPSAFAALPDTVAVPAQSRIEATAPGFAPWRPDTRQPVRIEQHRLRADSRVTPHCHAWAQLAWSGSGVLRLTTASGSSIVPPSRRCEFRRASSTP